MRAIPQVEKEGKNLTRVTGELFQLLVRGRMGLCRACKMVMAHKLSVENLLRPQEWILTRESLIPS